MASHFEAARGAYVIRDYRDRSAAGWARSSSRAPSTTANLVTVLPELDKAGLNVKIVAAISPQLFQLQDAAYREQVASAADRWDAMVISNRSRRVTQDWIAHPVVAEYSLTSDWDDRWRTGGSRGRGDRGGAPLAASTSSRGSSASSRDREKRLASMRAILDAASK